MGAVWMGVRVGGVFFFFLVCFFAFCLFCFVLLLLIYLFLFCFVRTRHGQIAPYIKNIHTLGICKALHLDHAA